MLNKLIELIHEDVDKKLRGEIAEWESDARARGEETGDNFREQPCNLFIWYPFPQSGQKNIVVNAGEKFLNVAL